jgi:hypothetical protein
MARKSKRALQEEWDAQIADLNNRGVGYDLETGRYFKLPIGKNNSIFTAFLKAVDNDYEIEEVDISAYNYLEAEAVAMVIVAAGIFTDVKLAGIEKRVGYYF